jgi:hypothetical protein
MTIIKVDSMDADEVDDALELRDPKVKAQIRQSNKDIRAGRTRPAEYPPADEYTPAQRRIIDARLAESEADYKTGRSYGPFNTADEMITDMKARLKKSDAVMKKPKRS